MLKFAGLGVIAAALMAATAQPASARFFDPSLKTAAPGAEQVACRTIRERVERPGGSVVFRTKRVCDHDRGPGMRVGIGGVDVRVGRGESRDCRTIRERIERPNGSVVYRKVRRCD
jgi:hypothetical protein